MQSTTYWLQPNPITRQTPEVLSPELANAVVADLAWCFEHQATVQFHLPRNTAGTVTITLPDGEKETGTWRVAVEKLRRRYGR